MNEVYITRLSKFLPNEPVGNEEMEDILGMVNDKPSRSRRLILRQNKITTRYYAIDKNGKITYTNADLTANAIKELLDKTLSIEDIDVLSCGTSLGDQLLPSHTSMVHGKLGGKPIEIVSPAGVCCAGMHALKYGYLSVKAGNSQNAVCTGSELISTLLTSDKFEKEIVCLKHIEENPILGFEKDFLRWMLSDGAGAVLLENKPNPDKLSLRIDWLETISYADRLETCMYAGGEKTETGELKGWKEYEPEGWLEKSIFSVKQDVKLLGKNVVYWGIKRLSEIFEAKGINSETDVDFFLPHLSSMYFKDHVNNEMIQQGIPIPLEKWFTNLTDVGNIGAASIYVMMEALYSSGKLKKGQKIVLLVPESGRFSYAFAMLTVC